MIVLGITTFTGRKRCIMPEESKTTRTKCGVETIAVVGGKWKPMILYALLNSPRRFGELNRVIPGVTQRMLTLQLRELEEDGVIHREVYKQVPPKVEYSLTPFGRTIEPLLLLMNQWGEQQRNRFTKAQTAR